MSRHCSFPSSSGLSRAGNCPCPFIIIIKYLTFLRFLSPFVVQLPDVFAQCYTISQYRRIFLHLFLSHSADVLVDSSRPIAAATAITLYYHSISDPGQDGSSRYACDVCILAGTTPAQHPHKLQLSITLAKRGARA